MANKPLILSDNLYENVILHPTFVLQVSQAASNPTVFDATAGHEPFRMADNLRDLTSCTVAATNSGRIFAVDCLTTQAPNILILDRGHNLAGSTVYIQGYTDLNFGTGLTIVTATIPATPGGLASDANGCLTPDGVWWKTFSPSSYRVQAFQTAALGAGIAPIITGLYTGVYYRFAEMLDAPGAYDYGTQIRYMRNELSRGGVRSKSRPINLDKLTLSLGLESTDYAAFHTEVQRMNRYGQPWWFCFDDSDVTGAGLMRLFQQSGDTDYSPQVNPVHREIRLELEEVIPSLYA